MARRLVARAPDPYQVLVEAFAVNERMNQIVIEHLEPGLWRATPPAGKGRTIAAIFAHVHNIRRKWLRLSAPHLELPRELDRVRCTMPQAKRALKESARRCEEMLRAALLSGRVREFRRDGWARPWPSGAAMVVYMIVHEAHHRGQVCMLANQLGAPLAAKVGGELYNWERLWRECGFTRPR
ncbi:MAG: DinB family protein [Terriglobia bacterium]